MTDKLKMYAMSLLHRVMREISEDFYCAGWLRDLEYDLWAFVCGDRETYGTYLSRELDDLDREYLLELANDAGGWYYWSDEPGHCEQFIAMDDWLKKYEEHKNEL